MTTIVVDDLITNAFQLAGITANGETPAPEESNTGLLVFNNMVDAWNLENFMIYSHRNSTFNLIANQQTYTIGPGGNFNTTRPVGIRSGYTSLSSIDYPLLSVGDAEYNQIVTKGITGAWPVVVNNDNAFPLSTLTFWPIPAQNMTVTLSMDVQFMTAALADTISYPPGFGKAFVYALAVELANWFNFPISQATVQIARETMGNIKVANLPDDVLNFAPEYCYPLINGRGSWLVQ